MIEGFYLPLRRANIYALLYAILGVGMANLTLEIGAPTSDTTIMLSIGIGAAFLVIAWGVLSELVIEPYYMENPGETA